MTAERIVEGVKESLGIISDDTDINNQIRGKAIAVMNYINNGGGNITPENATEYEILAIALGVNDLLNQNGSEFSEGFKAMAAQIQLRGGENDKI